MDTAVAVLHGAVAAVEGQRGGAAQAAQAATLRHQIVLLPIELAVAELPPPLLLVVLLFLLQQPHGAAVAAWAVVWRVPAVL
jgi:hypothetical protein